MLSWLSPQSLCGNSCTLGHDVHHVHHVPKCMSCHKAIVVITGRAHCFHDCTYILRPSSPVRFEHSVCRGSRLTTHLNIYII